MKIRLEREAAVSAAGAIKDFLLYPRAEGSHREEGCRGGSDLSLGEAVLSASWRSQLGRRASEGKERRRRCHTGENGVCELSTGNGRRVGSSAQ